MKKTSKLLFITSFLLLFAVIGCSPASEPQAQPQPTETPTAIPITPTQPASEDQEAPQAAENMDEKAVVKLTAEGIKLYWHVMTGGEGAGGTTSGGPIPTVQINGMEYRYLGQDIETNEKLMEYLQQVYTKEASEAFIKNANIVEHEGRLAQPNADGGSMLQWENAQASLIQEAADTKQFELKVSSGEGANVEFKPITVEVKNVEGAGWRINTPAHKLN